MLDMNSRVMEGVIKVRRLLFWKKRKMILMDDGTLYVLRLDNKFKFGLELDENTYFLQTKKNRFTLQSTLHREVIESPETEIWVSIMNSIKIQHIKEKLQILKR